MLATLIGGCSTWKVPGDWFGGEASDESAAAAPVQKVAETVPYYTAEAGVKLYSEPSFSSAPVTELSLHQKVYRSKLDRGFAFVRVDGSGQTGWVDNGKLIWRLPKETSSTAEPAEPAAREAPSEPTPAAIADEAPAAVEEVVAKPEPAAAQEASPEDAEAEESDATDPSLFSPF